jgi:hypothetical protein
VFSEQLWLFINHNAALTNETSGAFNWKENDRLGIDGDIRKLMYGGRLTHVSTAQAANRSETWGSLARTQHFAAPMHRYQLSRRKRKGNHAVGEEM